MSYQDLVVARAEAGIAVVTLNRPEKRNALRAETFGEIFAAVGELVADATVRAIVLTGAGDKAFSAGADLSAPPFSVGNVDEMLDRVQSMLSWMEEAGTPIVAAVNGDAFGGGLEIALACHFRVMSRTARLGLTETNLGIMPAAGGTQRLTRLVGLPRALECIVFGKRIDAEEALRIGLAHRLCEPGRALEEALAFARALARRAPLSVRGSIQAIYAGVNKGLAAGHKAERDGLARCASSADAMEGISAFFQKREPEFQGK
jgi:enoyl-CoA hydratase/carnithine racemase